MKQDLQNYGRACETHERQFSGCMPVTHCRAGSLCPAVFWKRKQRAGTGTRPYNRGDGVGLDKMRKI